MAKLPIVSGMEAVKALKRLGFFVDRQRGSHVVLKKITPEGERGCVIPMHREVALGTPAVVTRRVLCCRCIDSWLLLG